MAKEKKGLDIVRNIIIPIIISLIIGTLFIFFGQTIYDINKDLNIHYAGFNEETGYAKIEILNNFQKPLKFVEGNITINCEGESQATYKSKSFKLEGGRVFLPKEGSELLFSPDLFFSKLRESGENDCVDASLELVKYSKLNDTHSNLNRADVYDFKISEDELINISKRSFSESENSKLCIYCNISMIISTENKGNFEETKSYKFLSNEVYNSQYEQIIKTPLNNSGYFCKSRLRRLTSFLLCKNISSNECLEKLSKNIKNKYGDLDCESPRVISGVYTNLFSDIKYSKPEVFQYSLSQDEVREVFEKGPPNFSNS